MYVFAEAAMAVAAGLLLASSAVEANISDQTIIMDPEDVLRANSGKLPQCVTEKGIDFRHVDFANAKTLKKESFAQCVTHCLEQHPDRSHVLISHHDAVLWGDEFNCVCANRQAFANTTTVEPHKCKVDCPDGNGKFKCGDAKHNLLSVYCVRRDCMPEVDKAKGICDTRMPHDSHGCVSNTDVLWSRAHNVRNFSASTNSHTACIWECKDHHPHSMYSLTRKVGPVLTCTCGYAAALDPMSMVPPKYCSMLAREDDKAPFYNVNCVSDLDEGSTTFVPSKRCDSMFPFGCIYEEIMGTNNSKVRQVTLQARSNSSAATASDPSDCQTACYALFPDAYYVGVRNTKDALGTHCFCAKSDAFTSKMLGPNAACDSTCGYAGAGLFCGGGGTDPKKPPALSLYCVMEGNNTMVPIEGGGGAGIPYNYLRQAQGELQGIYSAILYENVTTDIIVVLLALLALVLTTVVFYLCVSQGVCELSRYS